MGILKAVEIDSPRSSRSSSSFSIYHLMARAFDCCFTCETFLRIEVKIIVLKLFRYSNAIMTSVDLAGSRR